MNKYQSLSYRTVYSELFGKENVNSDPNQIKDEHEKEKNEYIF